MTLSKADKASNFYPTYILLAMMSNDREKYLSWKAIDNVRMVLYNNNIVFKNKLRIITLFQQNL